MFPPARVRIAVNENVVWWSQSHFSQSIAAASLRPVRRRSSVKYAAAVLLRLTHPTAYQSAMTDTLFCGKDTFIAGHYFKPRSKSFQPALSALRSLTKTAREHPIQPASIFWR